MIFEYSGIRALIGLDGVGAKRRGGVPRRERGGQRGGGESSECELSI